MKKSHQRSLQKTVAFAATLAALGVSVGARVEQARAESPQDKYGAVQNKASPKVRAGARQQKHATRQYKIFRPPESRGGGMQPLNGTQAGATITNSGKVGTEATQVKLRTGAKQGGYTGPTNMGGAGGKQ